MTVPLLVRPSMNAASGKEPKSGNCCTIGVASIQTRSTGTVNRATIMPDSALNAAGVPWGHRLTVLFELPIEFAYTADPGHSPNPLVRLSVTPMREYALLI